MDRQFLTALVLRLRLLIFAAVLAAAVRLYLLWQYYCISSDGVRYIGAASHFYSGDIWAGLASVYPPGYPLLIAAAFPLVGDWELAGQLWSLVLGAGLVWPLYLLLRDALGERIAVVACVLAAVNPFLAVYSVHVRTESPFLFLSTSALLCFYRGIEKRSVGYVWCGALAAGFAYLVRPEALGFLVIVPAYLSFRYLVKNEFGPLWIAKFTGVLFLGFMLFAMPYIAYLSIDTGRWGAVSRKAGVTLAVSLNESGLLHSGDPQEAQDLESLEFFETLRRYPFPYAKKLIKDVLPAVAVFFEALHYSYVPFLLIGLFFVFREKFWERKDFLLLGFACFYIFGFILIYVKRRYSLQAVPVSLGWVALGMLWTGDYFTKSLSARRARMLTLLVMMMFLAGTFPKTLKAVSRDKAYVRDAGWYLAERNNSRKLTVAVFDDRITFYAQARPFYLTGIEEPDLSAQLRERSADYLAADVKYWQKFYPTIAAQPERHGLLLEKEFVGTRKDRLLVFKVM